MITKSCYAILCLALTINGCTPAAQPAGLPSGTATPDPVVAPGQSQEPETDLLELVTLIRQRLDVMPGVAQAKWNRKLAVTDTKREAALLTKLAADGVVLGLPETFVREFFQGQITASKLIQEQLIADWKSRQQPPFPKAPDLEREIRPQIDELNGKLLTALKKCWEARSNPGWKNQLDRADATTFPAAAWSRDVVDAALQPLRDLPIRK